MRRKDRRAVLGMVLVAVLLGGLLITPAGAHIGSVSHLINTHLKKTFYTKKQVYNRSQSNNRFVNHCDFEVPQTQIMAQALIDGGAASTDAFSDDGVLFTYDCVGFGAEVKKVGTGNYLVIFPPFWTDPDFLDDTPIVAIQPLTTGFDAVGSTYKAEGVDDVGTAVEVYLFDAGGAAVDAEFVLVVTEWLFGPGILAGAQRGA